ncbi:MAG: hypothetical protein QMD13_09960 [Candidatus Bathyarchaeia archaeon]|nr:hypothetical protein [Candidatus Bathyarchaeia archaeon]
MSTRTYYKMVIRAMGRFVKVFPTPESVAEDKGMVEKIIHSIGMLKLKAATTRALAKLVTKHGSMDKFLKADPDMVREQLLSIKGIGEKTADVILMTLFKRQVFPVDSHIARILVRLGIVEEDMNTYEVRRIVEPLNSVPVKVILDKGVLSVTFPSREVDEEHVVELVKTKLNLNHSSVLQKGWRAIEELELTEKYQLAKGFLPPKLSIPPRLLYTGLVKTVLLQMVGLPAAMVMTSRFVKSFGRGMWMENDGVEVYDFPKPDVITNFDEKTLKQRATISLAKATAIAVIARLELDGTLGRWEFLPTEELINKLMKVKGVGHWTASVTVMAGLSRWEAQPLSQLQRQIERLTTKKVTIQELNNYRDVSGYISVATLFVKELRLTE